MNSRSKHLIQKLKSEIKNESRLSKSNHSSFEIAIQFLDDCWNYVIENIKAEHPDYDDEQVLAEIRSKNELEIKIRDIIHKKRMEKSSLCNK
jgi:hypothetical protein